MNKRLSDKRYNDLHQLLTDRLTIKQCKELINTNDLRKPESSSMYHYNLLKEDYISVIIDLLTGFTANKYYSYFFTNEEILKTNLHNFNDDLQKEILSLLNIELTYTPEEQIKQDQEVIGFIGAVLKQDHSITPDGQKLYSVTGNVYQVTYDYYDHNVISDLSLISQY